MGCVHGRIQIPVRNVNRKTITSCNESDIWSRLIENGNSTTSTQNCNVHRTRCLSLGSIFQRLRPRMQRQLISSNSGTIPFRAIKLIDSQLVDWSTVKSVFFLCSFKIYLIPFPSRFCIFYRFGSWHFADIHSLHEWICVNFQKKLVNK